MAAAPAQAGQGPEAVPGFAPPAVAATPAGDPGTWVLPEDYPSAALQGSKEGMTGFVLDIDSAGRVDQCSVTQSSGASDLDEATCRLITQRALFKPAVDARGQAMPGRFRSRVKWVIPQVPPPQPGFLRTTYIVDADGKMRDCAWQAEGDFQTKMEKVPQNTCPNNKGYADGYTDEQGASVERRVVITTRIEVLPLSGAEPSSTKPAGQGQPVTGRAP